MLDGMKMGTLMLIQSVALSEDAEVVLSEDALSEDAEGQQDCNAIYSMSKARPRLSHLVVETAS